MTVGLKEIVRYLRMGCRRPDEALARRIAELSEEACKAARPAWTWLRTSLETQATVRRWLATSKSLRRHLAGCHAAYLACGTLGATFDAFQRKVSAVSGADAFIVQAIGAAMIEKWMDEAGDAIRMELHAGESLVPRYSPGYGDFGLSAQRELLELLDAPRKVGVSLTGSLLMTPSKSVSAVIGVRPGEPAP